MTRRRRTPPPTPRLRLPRRLAARTETLRILAVALAGLVAFAWRIGLTFADPRRVEWLFGTDDSAMFQIGWMFFRAEDWSWPLGRIAGYLYPGGATIALTDSLPLLALPGKLVAAVLPASFQYFGGWLLAGHVLQAVFAYLLARRFVPALWPRFLATALIFMAPVFLHRDGHIALSAHWVLLAAFWLYVRPWEPSAWHRTLLAWALLLAVTAQVHAYLAVMVAGVAVASLVRDRWPLGRLTTARMVGGLAVLVAVLAAFWLGVGYVQPGDVTRHAGSTYAHSALNLNFPWNGLGYLALTPGRPIVVENAFEAFSAPGAGVLLGVLIAAILAARRRTLPLAWRAHLPLLAVCAVCVLVAVSNRVALDGRVLVDADLPGFLRPFLDPFRAAARFAWPAVYALSVVVVLLLARFLTSRALGTVLAVCLALQVTDAAPLWSRRAAYEGRQWRTRLVSPEWDEALAHADKLLTYPPQMSQTSAESDFIDLTLLAREHGLPTSAGSSARIFRSDVVGGVDAMRDRLFDGPVDPGAIFVVRWSYWATRWPQLQERFISTRFDDFAVCIPRGSAFRPRMVYEAREMTLGELLERSGDFTVILAAKGGPGGGLDPASLALLREKGSRLATAGPADSYVLIMDRGGIVFEVAEAAQEIGLDLQPGEVVGATPLRRHVFIVSAGRQVGDFATIRVDDHEMALNLPGLNLVVLDEAQNVVAMGFLDPAAGPRARVFQLVPTAAAETPRR